MKTKKTACGWVITITNRVNGMLEQGGVCGRQVLYHHNQLRTFGLRYEDNPDGLWNEHITNSEYLLECVEPHMVIRRGTLIQ